MSLWNELAFLVVETWAPLPEVAAALPRPCKPAGTAPRSWALAKTIHAGQNYESNHTDLAMFALDGKVVVAPPGGCFMRTGETDWPRALSERFGRVWAFSAADYAPAVLRFDQGIQTSAEEPADETAVLEALAARLGAPDLKALFHTGDCALYSVFSSGLGTLSK